MNISELIGKLNNLQNEWGDIRVVCAPQSYRNPPEEGTIRLSLLQRLTGKYIVPERMCRVPDPCPWGIPGLGSTRHDGNPAIEVTL